MRSMSFPLSLFCSAQERELDASSNVGRRLKTSMSCYAEIIDKTNTPLGSNVTFTGATFNEIVTPSGAVATSGTNIRKCGYRAATVFANQAGTENFQENYDGVSTWRTRTATAVVASTLKLTFAYTMASSWYFRITYVNGAAAQATFEYSHMMTNSE